MATAQIGKDLTPKTSRVGKKPVPTPNGVTVTVATAKINVKGPKGELNFNLDPSITIAQADGELNVTSSAPGRDGARLQGMTRATIANMVEGVTTGYAKTLELVGTGYRIEMKGADGQSIFGAIEQEVAPLEKVRQ